jgi:hypothetical protein
MSAGQGGWSVYFASVEVEAMADHVKLLGGAVLFGPLDIPHRIAENRRTLVNVRLTKNAEFWDSSRIGAFGRI